MSLTASMPSPARNCFTASSSGLCIGHTCKGMFNKKPSCCNSFELLFGEIGSVNLIDQQYKTTETDETHCHRQEADMTCLFFSFSDVLPLIVQPFADLCQAGLSKDGLPLLLDSSVPGAGSCQESEHQLMMQNNLGWFLMGSLWLPAFRTICQSSCRTLRTCFHFWIRWTLCFCLSLWLCFSCRLCFSRRLCFSLGFRA